MAQFNFGSNTSTAQTGFAFGAQKLATPAFGTTQPTQPSGSITFGTPVVSVGSTQQNTGFGLGTATPSLNFGAPASSTPATGFGFGTPAKTTGLAFGTPASTGNLSFGAPAFGVTTTSAGTLGFGTPASSAPAPTFNFNTPASSANTSFGFGAPPTSTTFNLGSNLGVATSTASTGLFGTAATQPGLGGLSFNPPASTSSTGFGLGTFGATSGATSAAPFGAATTTPFGGATATPFGTATTTPFSVATTASFGGTASTPFAVASTTPTLSFGTTTTTASTGLSFGLGGPAVSKAPTLTLSAPGTALNFGFNAPAKTQTTTLATTSTVGLGGVDSSHAKTGTVNVGQVDKIAGKENIVPNEIIQSIDSFKNFVKDQKLHSSDVARGSSRPFVRVGEDIDLLNATLSEVGNDLQRNQQLADKLKHDSAKSLRDAEMAQRTFETPPGLQFENNAPLQYFIDLVNQFEQDLQALRLQIDTTDKHIQSLHEPKFLTSQELALGMRKLHDTFVALAGRLQSVHTQVESQKEQYLNLRKYILKDPTNIFVQNSKEKEALNVALQSLSNIQSKTEPGPTPFSTLGNSFGINMAHTVQQTPSKPPPAYPSNTTNLSFGTPSTGTTNFLSQPSTTSSLFGNTSIQIPATSTDSSGFQLQNPPPGNKRGKR